MLSDDYRMTLHLKVVDEFSKSVCRFHVEIGRWLVEDICQRIHGAH